jgi:nucleotide-binding universal stress UspA family protein
VIVVHAFEPIQLRSPYYEDVASRDEIISHHITEGKRIANEAAQKLQEAGVDVIIEVREGPAADAILRVVNADSPT